MTIAAPDVKDILGTVRDEPGRSIAADIRIDKVSAEDFDGLVTWFIALARTGVSDATGAPPLASATQKRTRPPRTGRRRTAAPASDSVEEVEAELIPLLTELERQWMPLLHETASRVKAASR